MDKPRTAMDWEIVPEGFTGLLVGIARDYPGLPMVITENGSAFEDVPTPPASSTTPTGRRTSPPS